MKRESTASPLQAFVLLNGPQFVEASRHLGERMITEGGSDIDQRISFGFRLVTARQPTAAELSVLREALMSDSKRFRQDPDSAKRLLQVGESSNPDHHDLVELAAYTELARLLLNLNEAITQG